MLSPARRWRKRVFPRHAKIIAFASIAINALILVLLLSWWKDWGLLRLRTTPVVCKRILLIVIFNFPYFDNVPVIRKLYSNAFARVVFYADKAEDKLGVHASRLEAGYFQQRAIAQAMGDYPDYDGYMWIGDDVLLNPYEVFAKLDVSKAWMAGWDAEKFCVENAERSLCTHQVHWEAPEGRPAANASLRHLPERYKRRSLQALGCTDCLAKGASDAAFIPAANVAEFRALSLVFQDVFFEFAIPTILLLMQPGSERIPTARAYYSWSTNSTIRFQEVRRAWHSETMDFVHPIKLSDPIQRQSAMVWLSEAKRYSRWAWRTPCV